MPGTKIDNYRGIISEKSRDNGPKSIVNVHGGNPMAIGIQSVGREYFCAFGPRE
jgi:hypothetical protein